MKAEFKEKSTVNPGFVFRTSLADKYRFIRKTLAFSRYLW